MKDIRKRIITFSLLGTMLTGLSACNKNELRIKLNPVTNREEITGKIKKEDLKKCYIIELEDEKGFTDLLFFYDNKDNRKYVENKVEEIYGEYGDVITIVAFDNLQEKYLIDKEIYNGNDIENIYIEVVKNFDMIKYNSDVKKLALKD